MPAKASLEADREQLRAGGAGLDSVRPYDRFGLFVADLRRDEVHWVLSRTLVLLHRCVFFSLPDGGHLRGKEVEHTVVSENSENKSETLGVGSSSKGSAEIVYACAHGLGSRTGPMWGAPPPKGHSAAGRVPKMRLLAAKVVLGPKTGLRTYVTWCSTTHVMSSGGRRAAGA